MIQWFWVDVTTKASNSLHCKIIRVLQSSIKFTWFPSLPLQWLITIGAALGITPDVAVVGDVVVIVNVAFVVNDVVVVANVAVVFDVVVNVEDVVVVVEDISAVHWARFFWDCRWYSAKLNKNCVANFKQV